MSGSVVRIGIGAVALGTAVMLISLSVVKGFKKEVYDKIIGFQSHITIKNRDMNMSYESSSTDYDSSMVKSIESIPGIAHVQSYATKPGIIKTDDAIQGIILKGVGSDFEPSFFEKYLRSGKMFKAGEQNDSILISQKTADLLKREAGDTLDVYFVQNPPRARRFIISGIYSTGLLEFDKMFMLCDIGHIQKLNGWGNEQIGGLEVRIEDFDKIDEKTEAVRNEIAIRFTDDMNLSEASNFKENNPTIVDWLSLSDQNIIIIIVLMILVSVFQMIAGMIVLILERTNMIGVLKTLGANNFQIRKIFLFNGIFLVLKGMFLGNATAYLLLFLQYQFNLLPLNPDIYYTDAVPVLIDINDFFTVNLLVFFVSGLGLLLPSIMISNISPAKTVKFE